MKTLLTTAIIACACATLGAQGLAFVAPADREIALAFTAQPPPPPPPPRGVGAIRVPLEARAIKGAPYSAEMEIESIQTLADGNRIVHRTTGRVYRDSAGRIRREEDQPAGQSTILIFDPEAGVSYSLDFENRIAWKTTNPATVEILKKLEAARTADADANKLALAKELAELEKALGAKRSAEASQASAEELQRRREEERRKAEIEAAASGARGRGVAAARVREQRVEEALGSRMIGGIRAEGVRRTTTIPAGEIGNELPIKIVSEEWTSPELQLLVLTTHSDPRMGESSYRMLNILRSEPNPTLFQIPSDYTVKETGIRRERR